MLSLLSKTWNTRGILVGFLILIVFSPDVSSSERYIVDAVAEDPVEILLILDHDYGGNVPFIIEIFERYGWSITTTGLNETLISCSYLGFEELTVDILMTEISDLTQFDAISIMPGNSHDLLRTNQTSLNLISTAIDQGLVVSAWCRGVRVLAAADVLDGKNITGNADYVSEYEAAGATFNELVPPIIDGNIVTGVRSRFYRDEMCQAIATAIGIYEPDAPLLVSATVIPQQGILGTSINLTVECSDATRVYSVNAKIYALNETTDERVSDVYTHFFTLNTTSIEDVYKGTVEDLDIGKYTFDLETADVYLNKATYTDAVNVSIVEQPTLPDWSGLIQWGILGAMVGFAALVVLVIYLRRR